MAVLLHCYFFLLAGTCRLLVCTCAHEFLSYIRIPQYDTKLSKWVLVEGSSLVDYDISTGEITENSRKFCSIGAHWECGTQNFMRMNRPLPQVHRRQYSLRRKRDIYLNYHNLKDTFTKLVLILRHHHWIRADQRRVKTCRKTLSFSLVSPNLGTRFLLSGVDLSHPKIPILGCE